MTNAQAALIAASGMGHANPNVVMGQAEKYLVWLDAQDGQPAKRGKGPKPPEFDQNDEVPVRRRPEDG